MFARYSARRLAKTHAVERNARPPACTSLASRFLPQPLPEGALETIIAAAIASTSSNLQPGASSRSRSGAQKPPRRSAAANNIFGLCGVSGLAFGSIRLQSLPGSTAGSGALPYVEFFLTGSLTQLSPRKMPWSRWNRLPCSVYIGAMRNKRRRSPGS